MFGLSRTKSRGPAAKAWNAFVAVVGGCRARPLAGGACLVAGGAVVAVVAQTVLMIATWGVFLCAAVLIAGMFASGQPRRRDDDRAFEAALNGFAACMAVGLAAFVAGLAAQVAVIAGAVLFVGRTAFLAYQHRQKVADAAAALRDAMSRRSTVADPSQPRLQPLTSDF